MSTCIVQTLRSLLRSNSGGIAVQFALGSIALIGIMGLAVDLSGANATRAKLQAAADAASLAGAKVLQEEDGTTSEAEAASADYLAAGPAGDISFNQAVQATLDPLQVTVSLTSDYPSLVRRLLAANIMTVGATSTAVLGPRAGPPVCVHALSSGGKGIEGSGGTSIEAPDCRVWVNSSSTSAVVLSGGSSVTAEKACIHGGVSGTVTPDPEDCGVRDDPFASMSPTTSASCDYNDYTNGGGTYTLSPGVYCGGLKLSGGPTVMLEPGTYVIRDGKLSMSGGGSMTGAGVTFVFEGSAEMDLSGGGDYHLTAPTEGTFKSFVFFQRPNANAGKTAKMSGGGEMYFEGIIYLPTWVAEVSGGGAVGTPSPWSAYIAQNFKYTGGSAINMVYDPDRITVPIPDAVMAGDRSIYLTQ
jgi:Flp pilus assembly protein TadG